MGRVWTVKVGRILIREKFLALAVVAGMASLAMTYYAVIPENPPDDGLQPVSTVYDAGKVRQGMVTTKFDLVNHSSVPVRIAHIVKSCRCAEVNAPSRDIAPLESATVDCRWDTSGMRGESQSTFVVVYSEGDGPGLKRLPLVMRGEVIPEFDYSPTRIEFSQGKAAIQRVTFVPRTPGGDIAIEKASCSHGAFSTTLPSQREIDVSFSPDLWPNGGQMTARLNIVTNCKTDRNIWIPIRVLPEANGHVTVRK